MTLHEKMYGVKSDISFLIWMKGLGFCGNQYRKKMDKDECLSRVFKRLQDLHFWNSGYIKTESH